MASVSYVPDETGTWDALKFATCWGCEHYAPFETRDDVVDNMTDGEVDGLNGYGMCVRRHSPEGDLAATCESTPACEFYEESDA